MSQDQGGRPTRPLCPCHGEPMDTWTGGDGYTRSSCPVARRARQREYHRRNAPARNYARSRALLRQRMRAKVARIKELEASIA